LIEKAGLAPAFLVYVINRRLLTAAAISAFFRYAFQQTVDGLQGTLEIPSRSSYVPNLPTGVRSPLSGEARPKMRVSARLEMPLWMKF
jgi:hypothetical protein